MFYDKEFEIMKQSKGYKDDYGIWHDGKLEPIKPIECDAQPITQEIAKRDFGYEKEVSYRIFCDVDDLIQPGTIIEYKQKQYEIKKMMVWDDYIDMIVGDDNV